MNHIDVISVAPATHSSVASTEDSLRERVRDAVAGRVPVDGREEDSIRRFLADFDRLDDPFSQEADPVHVTGSGIVVGGRGVVLLKHRRLGIWLQPGGHLDEGETPWDAAQRESVEETGLELVLAGPRDGDGVPELQHVDVHLGGRGHTHLDLRYLLTGGDDDPRPPEGESQEVAWFGWDEAIAIADPGAEGILRHLRPGRTGAGVRNDLH